MILVSSTLAYNIDLPISDIANFFDQFPITIAAMSLWFLFPVLAAEECNSVQILMTSTSLAVADDDDDDDVRRFERCESTENRQNLDYFSTQKCGDV